jgi:hypothetical protein
MKPKLLLPFVLLVPFALLVSCVARAADRNLELGVDYKSFGGLSCSITAGTTCTESLDSEDFLAQPKVIHSATIRLLAQTGSTCGLSLVSFHLVPPTSVDILFVGYATEESPVTLSVPFPQPLEMAAPDILQVQIQELTGMGGGCGGEVIAGVELLK